MPNLRVRLKSGSYQIVVGSNDDRRLGPLVARALGDGRLFVFYDAQFYALHGATLCARLGGPKRRVVEMVLPRGERTKSSATLERLYAFLLGERISRATAASGAP